MNVTWRNSLGKIVFGGFCGIQILKVTYMSYLGKVFESFTNPSQAKFKVFKDSKISGVSRFLFWATEPIWNMQTTEDCQFGWMVNCFITVCFFKLLIMFFVWKSFFSLFLYYFPAFPAFPSNWLGLASLDKCFPQLVLLK